MNRFKMIASVYGLFIKSNKILLLKRNNTGYEDGNYGLSAGHVEDNESITLAACREINEETGVIIKPKDIKLVHVMHRKEKDIRVDFFFLIKSWKNEPKNNEPEKCDELDWFDLNKLPPNIIPYIKSAIKNFEKKIFYSEIGWKAN